jgi:hypothetical protein
MAEILATTLKHEVKGGTIKYKEPGSFVIKTVTFPALEC